jgi:hypothetical protein
LAMHRWERIARQMLKSNVCCIESCWRQSGMNPPNCQCLLQFDYLRDVRSAV